MMITFLLSLLSLAPLTTVGAETQEVAAVTPPVQQARTIRFHSIAALTGIERLGEIEARLADPRLSETDRQGAYAEYKAATTEWATGQTSERIVDTLEFLCDTEFKGSAVEMTPTVGRMELIVLASKAQHEAIAVALESLAGEERQVYVEAMIVRVPKAEMEGLVGDQSARVMNEKELAALNAAFASMPAIEQVNAPKLLTLIAFPASMSIGNTVSYVSDYELNVMPDGSDSVADPVISSVFNGQRLDVRAAPFGDALRVSVEFASSTLESPIPVTTVQFGARGKELEVEIQTPVVRTMTASALFDLTDNGAVILSGVDPEAKEEGAETQGIIVVLHARLLGEDDLEELNNGHEDEIGKRKK